MNTLKRRVNLKVTSPTGERLLDDSTLRIDFEVNELIGGAMDTAEIKVYNLNPELVSYLSSRPLHIAELNVTHPYSGGKESLVFKGRVMNTHASSLFEDHITTLYCWADGSYEGGSSLFSYSAKLRPMLETLDYIREDINKVNGKVVFSGFEYSDELTKKAVEESVIAVYSVDKVTHFEALQQALTIRKLTFSKSGSVLKIYRRPNKVGMEQEMVDSGAAVYDIQSTLLKQPIEFGIANAAVYYSLAEYIRPADIIRLNPSQLQTSVRGYDSTTLSIVTDITKLIPNNLYFLLDLQHKGSAYTDDWQTTLNGIIYKDAVGGSNG